MKNTSLLNIDFVKPLNIDLCKTTLMPHLANRKRFISFPSFAELFNLKNAQPKRPGIFLFCTVIIRL